MSEKKTKTSDILDGIGDVTLRPGYASRGPDTTDDAIKFQLANGQEMMRFEPNGKCFVRGELVEENLQIWNAFKEWLMDGLHGRRH